MDEPRLRRFFHALQTLSLASPAVLLAACPSGEIAPYVEPGLCLSSLWCDDVSRLRPAMRVDYLELRDIQGRAGDVNGCVVSSVGSKCAGASDLARCQRSVATLQPSGGFLGGGATFGGGAYALVTTLRDQVQGLALQPDVLVPFLQPIDSEQEAALLARASGYGVDCASPIEQVVRRTAAGYEVVGTTGSGCGPGNDINQHTLQVTPDGAIAVQSTTLVKKGDPNCVIGRRPDGMCAPEAGEQATSALGQHFATMAQLEAASVAAFEILRRELRFHGAPDVLCQLAQAAQQDERRHAQVTMEQAQRFAATPARVRLVPRPLRSLLSIALENEVEGCVRETFGALVGAWQAEHAADQAIRQIMHTIAEEELRHAALAWQVRAWILPRLTPSEKQRLHDAQAQAIAVLRAELAEQPAADLVHVAGLPCPRDAVALLDRMEQETWRLAAA